MIVPDPKTVRTLLTRFASLKIDQAERARPATARELEDVTYTLCVLMGTSDVREAIAAADALLAAAVRPPAGRAPGKTPAPRTAAADTAPASAAEAEKDEDGLFLTV
ncbi:DUF5133 domain-containing protein [Streptomyces sp. A012304]|uniref:DUF5133 domain-containing protein n=1 Tax=Streptomyces sp. A012304 TaxID=375446 RepID=UPI0022322364|nr:DUF5133 domain-containing protein [Streptomyces sp. A012304]